MHVAEGEDQVEKSTAAAKFVQELNSFQLPTEKQDDIILQSRPEEQTVARFKGDASNCKIYSTTMVLTVGTGANCEPGREGPSPKPKRRPSGVSTAHPAEAGAARKPGVRLLHSHRTRVGPTRLSLMTRSQFSLFPTERCRGKSQQ